MMNARCWRLALAMGLLVGSWPLAAAAQAKKEPAETGPQALEDIEELRDIEYGKVGKRSLKLHIYRKKPTASAEATAKPSKLPCVVWIHGGGWKEGTKDSGGLMLTTFARMGFVGASIEYRFSQEAPFPAQVEDCKCAVRFLRANASKYQIDPERIGAWGISAGGHLATMLAVTGGLKEFEGQGGSPDASSRVQAACNWCGPSDLPTWFGEGMAPLAKQAVTGLIGGPYEKQKERAAQASPVTHLSADDAPILIMHGDKDDLVPLSQAQYLARAFERAGVKHKLTVVKGGGHVFISPTNNAEVLDYFTRELKATP